MTVRDGEDPALPEVNMDAPFATYATDDLGPVQPLTVRDHTVRGKVSKSECLWAYENYYQGITPGMIYGEWCNLWEKEDTPFHRWKRGEPRPTAQTEAQPQSAADILDKMAATFRERQKTYGSNYKMVAPIMAILFPNGLPSNLAFQHKFHLFELIIVKLSRFAISELSHEDSIHDLGVYAAMVEACLLEEKK